MKQFFIMLSLFESGQTEGLFSLHGSLDRDSLQGTSKSQHMSGGLYSVLYHQL